jgi:hypothetical protein
LNGTGSRLTGSVSGEGQKIKFSSVKSDQHRLHLVLPVDSLGSTGIVRLSAPVSANVLFGIGEMADGQDLYTGRESDYPVNRLRNQLHQRELVLRNV